MRYLNPIQQSRDIVQEFRGYNHNLRIAEGEFYDEQNMSSDYYPVMSPRKKRIYDDYSSDINGIIAYGDDLVYTKIAVSGLTTTRKLFKRSYGGEIELFDFSSLSDVGANVDRQLVPFGAYIVIFPDGVFYNLVDSNDKGSINTIFQASGSARFALCDENGDVYYDHLSPSADPSYTLYTQLTPPDPVNDYIDENTFWLKSDQNGYYQGAETPVLYRYTSTLGWTEVTPVYVKIEASGIAEGFSEGDAITASNAPSDMAWIDGEQLIKGVHNSAGENDVDAIWFEGIIDVFDMEYNSGALFKVTREAPVMDFVVESNNRLWGCRHGENNSGNYVNEIYACKLGDFKNWFAYDGTSVDSYAVSVGTPGDFTGAVSYLGYPIFFKDGYLHKIYGNVPSNFQTNTTACAGVAEGAWRSVAICGAKVYYKSRAGVCVYDGSLPVDISAAFGDVIYSGNEAVGGADDYKYYLSCFEQNGGCNLFVYDTRYGVWHREDSLCVSGFACLDGVMHFVEGGKLGGMEQSGYDGVEWHAESGEIGLLLPDKQYVAKIVLKMACALGAQMDISIQYDGVGDWQHVETVHGTGVSSQSVAVKPERCAFFRLRFSGIGDVKLYGYIKTTETGSDL